MKRFIEWLLDAIVPILLIIIVGCLGLGLITIMFDCSHKKPYIDMEQTARDAEYRDQWSNRYK